MAYTTNPAFTTYPAYYQIEHRKNKDIVRIGSDDDLQLLAEVVSHQKHTICRIEPKVKQKIDEFPCLVKIACSGKPEDEYIITLLSQEHWEKIKEVYNNAACGIDQAIQITLMEKETQMST